MRGLQRVLKAHRQRWPIPHCEEAVSLEDLIAAIGAKEPNRDIVTVPQSQLSAQRSR
jgi:hypothetical protein